MYEAPVYSAEEESALLQKWFETVSFDQESPDGELPPLDNERDDEERSLFNEANKVKRGNPYRDENGKFTSKAKAATVVPFVNGQTRHLPGKHDQKDHAGGQNRIRPTDKTPPPPKDATKWAEGQDKDMNVPGGFSYGEMNDPVSRPLVTIAKHQGFDAKPTKGSVDDEIKNGGLEIHRGIVDHERSGTSAKDIEDKFLNGAYEPGTGNYGNGYYFSTSAGVGRMYANAPIAQKGYNAKPVKGGIVVRAALKKDAKIANYEDMEKQQRQWYMDRHKDIHFDTHSTGYIVPKDKLSPRMMDGVADPGHFAALMGYDAIRVPLMNRETDKRNKARIQKMIGEKDIGDEIVVLNRGALVVDG